MFLITKVKSAIIFFILIISFTVTGSLHAQSGNYIGNEANIESGSLLSKANMTDFEDQICAKIFKDDKNTYYAVDVSKLSSRYEKIRILELSYEDKVLVSMGSDTNTKYYYFLVNNTLDKSPKEIDDIVFGFLTQLKNEEKALNDEQMRLWLIQHDKYTKK